MFVSAPIISRIFQELNQGHVNYLEALAVAQTPYPLPLAQMANIVVFLFAILIAPVQFAATVVSLGIAIVANVHVGFCSDLSCHVFQHILNIMFFI